MDDGCGENNDNHDNDELKDGENEDCDNCLKLRTKVCESKVDPNKKHKCIHVVHDMQLRPLGAQHGGARHGCENHP